MARKDEMASVNALLASGARSGAQTQLGEIQRLVRRGKGSPEAGWSAANVACSDVPRRLLLVSYKENLPGHLSQLSRLL